MENLFLLAATIQAIFVIGHTLGLWYHQKNDAGRK